MSVTSSGPGSSQPLRYEEVNVEKTAPGGHFALYDELREQAGMHFGLADGHEFWMVTRMEEVLELLQTPQVFSSSSVVPNEPDPPYKWIPEMLDGKVHVRWRQLLGPFFAPGAVNRLEPQVRQVFDEILDEVAGRGRCDYVAEVALKFPNVIFMGIMGLPVSDADQFQKWETAILHTAAEHRQASYAAMGEVMNYFNELITDRKKHPRDDLLSAASGWQIEGEPVSQSDLLALCLLLFMAGLDTVAQQLSYSTYHLATHPEDRRRINQDPALIEPAIEELLRYYSFVSPGRKITQDTTLGGCPLKAGQMVWFPLASANRDPREFPNAGEVVIDRKENRHLAFGAGPHRCLGSNLARRELTIGLTEWHRRIPDYSLDPDIPVREHGGQVGLDNLPLLWTTG